MMALNDSEDLLLQMAQRVKDACLRAARDGFEEAGMAGLCAEGALENAMEAIRLVDLEAIVARTSGD